jgi:hypothetical protein
MRRGWLVTAAGLVMIGTAVGTLGVRAQDQAAKTDPSKSSYASVNEDEFRSVFARMSAAKAVVMERQMDLLGARYDLGDHAATGVTMSRGKPVQDGVRVKLPGRMTWEALAQMIPEEIRTKGLFRAGFLLDLPDRFLPEFPAPIYLTTRLDLGDVSRGQPVTIDNYYALFNGLLNPKQLDGLRLLLTPFPQQQFNLTADRRSEHPEPGGRLFRLSSERQ